MLNPYSQIVLTDHRQILSSTNVFYLYNDQSKSENSYRFHDEMYKLEFSIWIIIQKQSMFY